MTVPSARHDRPRGGPTDAPVEVSVVIAARDEARTLPHQLRALAAQRPACSWEVVLADNGSTDGTLAVAEAARSWLPELRTVDASAVRGAGAARNVGVAASRGSLVLFCDADDVVAPGWVEALRAGLRRTELVAGRLEWRLLNDPAAQASRALPQDDALQHGEPLPDLPCASSSNLGVRRDVFRRLGGFDPAARFLQDTDLCWRAQLSGAALGFEPSAVVHMRLRSGLRGAWRQGRSSGMGQRWLAARYGAVAAARAGVAEAEAGAGGGAHGAGGAGGSASGGAPAAGEAGGRRLGAGRSWPARVVRRAGLVAGEVLRVRSAGDAARLAWSTGFGVGYALGGLPDPEPYAVPSRVVRASAGCA
ncbi:glycosyltransferase [Cellulomonas pakistanensis]|uniref:Glycosyltransferase 2-like domain-containing protein n=1 Tax=Cellulomonas pakistanensis TaxID=992287 RepID=A0A919P9R9_9CELL|nr:glycosyltransferase family A protein [Cellulomonas pakistanensis]GIG36621.1 hypothetical protein Cpa01nite_20020 [Cellulomonas pakistanensis]